MFKWRGSVQDDWFYSSDSGENPLPADDPNKELMGKTEVSLTLTNKFDVPGEANAEMDARTLLLKWVNAVDSVDVLVSFQSEYCKQ